PTAEPQQPVDPDDPEVTAALDATATGPADPAAEEVPTDTGELPTSVLGTDGEPLTRRELRERERARLEAERVSARPWWRFGRTKPAAGQPADAEKPA